jgi:hypothetical protein
MAQLESNQNQQLTARDKGIELKQIVRFPVNGRCGKHEKGE